MTTAMHELTPHETAMSRAVEPTAHPKLRWTQLLAFYADNAATIAHIETLPLQIVAAYEAGDVVAAWSLSKQLGDLVVQLEQAWVMTQVAVVSEADLGTHQHRARRAGFEPKKWGDGTIAATIINAVLAGVKNAGGISGIISIILKLAGGVAKAGA